MKRQGKRIIVEGMDGSGKTTLISSLMEMFPSSERIVNTLEDKQDFSTFWPQQLDRKYGPVVPIHDRFFFSELVYGPVLRGKINAPDQLVANADWFLRGTAFLIYCRPHSDALKAGVLAKPQMEGVLSSFDALLTAYDTIMNAEKSWFADRFFHYDWRRPGDLDKLKIALEEYLGAPE